MGRGNIRRGAPLRSATTQKKRRNVDLFNLAEWSHLSEVNKYRRTSRTYLRAPEALAFLNIKYAFSHFLWYRFFKNFNLHLCRHITTLFSFYTQRLRSFHKFNYPFCKGEEFNDLGEYFLKVHFEYRWFANPIIWIQIIYTVSSSVSTFSDRLLFPKGFFYPGTPVHLKCTRR